MCVHDAETGSNSYLEFLGRHAREIGITERGLWCLSSLSYYILVHHWYPLLLSKKDIKVSIKARYRWSDWFTWFKAIPMRQISIQVPSCVLIGYSHRVSFGVHRIKIGFIKHLITEYTYIDSNQCSMLFYFARVWCWSVCTDQEILAAEMSLSITNKS